MINTVLFDLDGTLLPMDFKDFEKEYFKRLTLKFAEHIEPNTLINSIWKSTKKIIMNTKGEKTNKELFFEDFIAETGQDPEVLNSLFNDFYINEYKDIGTQFKEEKKIVKIVEMLIERGYNLVLATNPIFPLEAIIERIKWAGLKKDYFKLITSLESMHFCKPNVEYYEEILGIMNKSSKECIMIGNDVGEDMIASKLGIRTFLLEDCIIDNCDVKPAIDHRGNYQQLYDFLSEKLPKLDV